MLPYDPVRGEILLVEQFRVGALEWRDTPWCLELIAGIADKDGESAEDLIRREAIEEAGLTLAEMETVAQYMPSPGGTNERLHVFVGKADLAGAGGIFGCADEGEDIRAMTLSADTIPALLTSGRVDNAASLICVAVASSSGTGCPLGGEVTRRDRYRLDFRALMSQCEENYARMLPLMNALGDRDQMQVDQGMPTTPMPPCRCWNVLPTPPRCDWRIRSWTSCRVAAPVRLYHDARLAEVTEARPFRRVNARYAYPNRNMHQRDEKAQWNRFLAEWLRHVHDHGRDSGQQWRQQVTGG